MAYIYDIPSEAFNPQTWANIWSVKTPSSSSVSNMVRNEENDEKIYRKEQLSDWLKWRSEARNMILRKWVTDKWQDQAEIRKTRLADIARWALEEMWKDPEAIMKAQDDDIIKRLVGSSNWTDINKLKAVNDYIQNWWYADDVFNYLVWNTKSIYEEKKEKNKLQKAMDKIKWTFVWNAIMNIPWTRVREWAWLSNLVEENVSYWWEKIADINKASDIAWLWNIIWNVSEDRYQKYKKWELKSKWYEPYWEAELPQNIWAIWSSVWLPSYANELDFYKSYDNALEKWFLWSVEDYWDYIYKKAWETYTKTADKVREFIDKEIADPKASWSWWGKFIWEMLELWAMPTLSAKYLKNVPVVWKWIEKWIDISSKYTKPVKEAIEKVPFLWKQITKWVENAPDLAAEWAMFQLLDDAYQSDLSELSDYERMAKWNVLLWWAVRWLWEKFFWLNPKQQEAFLNKSKKEIDEINKVTDDWLNKSNQTDTPMTRIKSLLENVEKKLTEKRVLKWKELESVEWWLKWSKWQKYDAKDMLKEIEVWFEWLKDTSKWWLAYWEKAILPKFFEDWKTLLSENSKNALNTYTRNEQWQIIKLWDEIEKLWNEIFTSADRKINASTSKEFFDWLKWILWESWWSKRWKWVKIMREVFDKIETKFKDALSETSKTSLEEATSEAWWAINLSNTFREMIWRLWWTEWVWTAEKVSKDSSKAAIEQLFTTVKENLWIDLNNEIWAWIISLSLRDPKLAEELTKKIYPSQPWGIEFIMKWIMNMFRKTAPQRYAQDAKQSVWSKMSEVVPSSFAWQMFE